jgi:hypothetical protein
MTLKNELLLSCNVLAKNIRTGTPEGLKTWWEQTFKFRKLRKMFKFNQKVESEKTRKFHQNLVRTSPLVPISPQYVPAAL